LRAVAAACFNLLAMPPLPLKIAGIGRYLPSRVVSSAEVERLCGLDAGWIERKTGVRERRWVNGETNSFMGAQAAREAVAAAGLALADIDLIINASGSQEQAIPDGGPLIQRQLGLETSGVPCLSVHATCLSFIAAVDLSSSLLATGRARRILVVSADIGSVGLNLKEPESASLIGDAAAAVVLTTPAPGEPGRLLAARFETYSAGADLTEIRGGGTRRHPNHPETRPEDNLFHMEGPLVYRMAREHLGGFLDRLRPGLSQGLDGIKLVVPHQASLFAVRLLRKYGIPDDRVMVNLDRVGNCIATSIPSALYDALLERRLARGEQVLLLGTGAGLSFGGLILEY
jgi:3-oxoacyl-[acyl-carrier-protein] synthase-3